MTRPLLMKSTAMALCLALTVPAVAPAQTYDLSGLETGQMPSVEQIDEMERELLVKLGVLMGLDRDAVLEMDDDELRIAVKTELGLEVSDAEEALSEQAEEAAEAVTEGAAEVVAETNEALEAEAEVETEAEAAAETNEALEAEVEAEAEAAAETNEALQAEVEAEVEAATEDAAEQTEDLREALEEAQVVIDPADSPVVEEVAPADPGAAGLVSASDIDAMGRDQLLALATDLSLDIGATEDLTEDQLRTEVKLALGMEVEASAAEVEVTESAPVEAENPPMAADDDAATAEGEVVVETLTEDNVRSSNEAFDTEVIVEQPAEQGVDKDDDKKDKKRGFTDAETAAALGLGVLALSQILGNADEVVSNSGDRVVVRRGTELQVIKDDDVLLRRPGAQVETRNFEDGSSRVVVTRPDGSQVITVRSADGTVVRRVQVRADGTRIVLFDDTEREVEPVDVTTLPEARPAPVVTTNDRSALEAALNAQLSANVDRRFTLNQVRTIREVRHLMPEVTLDAVNFQTGSAVIQPGEAEELADLGSQLADFIAANPDELFLVEGHTDTVGDAAYNLALSDRRAESVALALVEYFNVPPENLVIQGYGESDLLVPREGPERANRRATVRRITPLLQRSARLD
ncbi:OmpA family protein [Marinovum sp.]|uniref:OmpA family protein n=1 Tax=Marinovum sp. TaxID=2024839 RepID=UPI003A8DC1C6